MNSALLTSNYRDPLWWAVYHPNTLGRAMTVVGAAKTAWSYTKRSDARVSLEKL